MLKIAIIGAGVMGGLHTRILSQLPRVKLVAVCDNNNKKGKSLADIYKTKYYSNYTTLLTKEALDGVTIAVPTSFHKEVALACIKAGVNVLVEKPLAQSAKDAALINEAAQKKKVILAVGHIERFNPAVVKLKEFIKKGVFGKIVSVVIKRVGLYPPRIKDVNVITDLAVHDLDIICSLLNKFPKRLFANGGAGISRDQIDYADIILDFDGITCYLQVNWITPIKIRTLSITGTSGYGELNYITQELILYKDMLDFKLPLPQEFKKFVSKFGKPKKISVQVKKEEPLKLEILDFLNSIITKKPPVVTGEQGVLALKLTETVLESLSQKKLIQI